MNIYIIYKKLKERIYLIPKTEYETMKVINNNNFENMYIVHQYYFAIILSFFIQTLTNRTNVPFFQLKKSSHISGSK